MSHLTDNQFTTDFPEDIISTTVNPVFHPSSPISGSETSECWHCSLTSYKVSYLSAEAMHHFIGYVLPGTIFVLLGLRWAGQLVLEWTRQMLINEYDSAGLPATPRKRYVLFIVTFHLNEAC